MKISELVEKLETVRAEHGDRDVVKLKLLDPSTGYELAEPQLVMHYLNPSDESEYAVQIC